MKRKKTPHSDAKKRTGKQAKLALKLMGFHMKGGK